jgi:succinylglutamate desuccinylase
MNRCFLDNLVPQNDEEKRVMIIKETIKKADILIDIHNTIRNHTYPFIITEDKNSKLIDYFEPKYIVE